MKKADIITIAIILLVSLSFYFYYINTNKLTGDIEVVILYQGDIIYQDKWNTDSSLVIGIGSEDFWTTASQAEYEVDEVILVDEDIVNIVYITGEQIDMIRANCKNKHCLGMHITRGVSTAIVCTNGIIVKLSVSDPGETIIGGIIWWK